MSSSGRINHILFVLETNKHEIPFQSYDLAIQYQKHLRQNRIPDKFCPGEKFHPKISKVVLASKIRFLENRILEKITRSGCSGHITDTWDHHKALF